MSLILIILYKIFFNPIITSIIFPFFLIFRKVRQTILAHFGIFRRLKKNIQLLDGNKSVIWIHVASAGEFLQIKSMVRIFQKHKYQVFITVTSISGYNWLKREKNDNLIFEFLPLDFSYNAKLMLKLIQPKILIFVKNDIWPNLLRQVKKLNIPRVLVCAPEKNSNSIIKKSFYKFLYSDFTAIYPVTVEGGNFYRKLLGPEAIIKSVGDSKYDIVLERIKERTIKLSMIKKGDICALFGSIWPEDLEVVRNTIISSLQKYPKLKVIVAPHENDDRHVKELENMFKDHNPVLFSNLQSRNSRKNTTNAANVRYFQSRVLIVDTIGDLFFLYENSSIAYVGGGFSTGIHNILEPCAMKNSVIFGPRHHKFPEAKNLIANKCAFSIQNAIEFENIFNELIINPQKRTKAGSDSYKYITQHTGASQTLYTEIINLIANNN